MSTSDQTSEPLGDWFDRIKTPVPTLEKPPEEEPLDDWFQRIKEPTFGENVVGVGRGLAQGAVHAVRAAVAMPANVAETLGDVALYHAGLERPPVYDASGNITGLEPSFVGKAGQAIEGPPLPEPKNTGEAIGQQAGSFLPYLATGPLGAATLAGGTSLADHYREARAAGLDEGAAFGAAAEHGITDSVTMGFLPPYLKSLELHAGEGWLKKAVASGSIFEANNIVHNVIDKYSTDEEREAFTGSKGAVGSGILTSLIMDVIGHGFRKMGVGHEGVPSREVAQSGEVPQVRAEGQGGAGAAVEPGAEARGEEPGAGAWIGTERGGAGVGAEPAHAAEGVRQLSTEHTADVDLTGTAAPLAEQVGEIPEVQNAIAEHAQEPDHAAKLAEFQQAADAIGAARTEDELAAAIPAAEPGTQETGTDTSGKEDLRSPTSVKNAIVDEERATRGLEPLMQEAAREHPAVWDEAMRKLDADPEAGKRLVAELNNKPRAVSDVEEAILDHERVSVGNDYDLINRQINAARESGNEAERVSLEPRAAAIRDYFDQVDTAGKAGGREAARSLSFRRRLVDDEYNMLPMEQAKQAALGRPLTDAERAHVADLSERIRRLETETTAIEKSRAEAQPKKQARILSFLDKQAEAARARLKERLFRASAGFDPTSAADVAIIGAQHIGHGIADFASWSAKMVEEFGEKIKPHLEAIFAAAHEHLDKAEQASALEASKTRVRADIADLEKQIATGEKREPKTRTLQTDTELEALKKRRSELNAQLTGKPKQIMSDAERQARSLKRQIELLETKRAAGDTSKKGAKQGPDTAEVAALKERRRALLQEVADYRSSRVVKLTPEQAKDKAYQKRAAQLTEQYKQRTAEGDFAPAQRAQRELSTESEAARTKLQEAKNEWQAGQRKDQLARRSTFEKGADLLVAIERGLVKLSSPGTLLKLGQGVQRLVTTPLEEVLGGVLGKVPGYRGIFERAPREGGFNVDAIAKGYGNMWKNTVTQAAKKMRTGNWDFETLYGKGQPQAPEFTGFFGRLHGMLKTPEALNEFGLATAKREAWAARNMQDPMNPIVQMGIGIDSAKNAEASVFNQDSRVADEFNGLMRRLEAPSKVTGRTPMLGKLAATAGRVEVPFAKVPSNIVGEAMQNAIGAATGNLEAAAALRRGVESLKPEEADMIARHLKKGYLGGAVLLLGFFNHENVGGFYTPGKRRPEDVKFGEAKFGGVTVPKWMNAMPIGLVYQLGGTIGRVADSFLRKRDIEPQGLPMATLAGTLGLLSDVPLVGEVGEIGKAIAEPAEREGIIGRHVAGDIVPAGVSWAARRADIDAQGNPIQRKAVTVGENIKAGIPGARETLPVKR